MKGTMIKRIAFLLFLGVTSAAVFGQNITINGTVTDIRDGSPLPGVSIVVKGTTTGTASNLDGQYTLTVPEDATLVFSFIGYNTIMPVLLRLSHVYTT